MELALELLAESVVILRVRCLLLLHGSGQLVLVDPLDPQVHAVKVVEEGLERLLGLQILEGGHPFDRLLDACLELYLVLRYGEHEICLAHLPELHLLGLISVPLVHFEDEAIVLVDHIPLALIFDPLVALVGLHLDDLVELDEADTLVENFVHTAHLHGVARVISLTNLIYLYPLEELQTALLEVGHHCLLIVLLGGVDPDDLILQLDLDV